MMFSIIIKDDVNSLLAAGSQHHLTIGAKLSQVPGTLIGSSYQTFTLPPLLSSVVDRDSLDTELVDYEDGRGSVPTVERGKRGTTLPARC